MARPRKEINYETLKAMCKIQCTGEECASALDIDYDTLNNHLKEDGHGGFSEFFKRNRGAGLVSLRRMQFKSAEKGNATMQIWLGKQHLGQREKSEIEYNEVQQTGARDFGADSTDS